MVAATSGTKPSAASAHAPRTLPCWESSASAVAAAAALRRRSVPPRTSSTTARSWSANRCGLRMPVMPASSSWAWGRVGRGRAATGCPSNIETATGSLASWWGSIWMLSPAWLASSRAAWVSRPLRRAWTALSTWMLAPVSTSHQPRTLPSFAGASSRSEPATSSSLAVTGGSALAGSSPGRSSRAARGVLPQPTSSKATAALRRRSGISCPP